MKIWITILGMAAVTYGTRTLPLTTLREEALPLWVRHGLKYVPIAVLSAIIGPEYLPAEDWFQFTVDGHLVAGIAAIAVAWFTKSTLITIFVGMAILVALT
jgi:branched-subunit amino acid transport protein